MDESAGNGWLAVAKTEEFDATDRKLVDLGGDKQVGLFKVDGSYHAISVWCSHQKMSMMEGELEGGELMCPAHGARFDVRTGKQLCLPAVRPVPVYPTKTENGVIYLKDV